jgi:pyrroloquinoline quinone biosynthesis protein E
MSLECFKNLIDAQYGLVEIKLNGLGEALMQGDDYFEMIRYARSKRIWVRMTTNASLLGVNDNYKKLADSGVNEIDISIDGADAETFEAIRVGGSYRHVIKNCKQLNDYLAKPRSKMWTLVQARNAHNLKAHVRLAADIGFKHLVFSLSMHGWGDDVLAKQNDAASFELTPHELQELIAEGVRMNVRVAFWDVADKFTKDNPCPWPFERAVVTSDSRVTPCCMIGDPDALEISGGNSFAKIWYGVEYQAFRLAHLQGIIPSACKGCYKLDGG